MIRMNHLYSKIAAFLTPAGRATRMDFFTGLLVSFIIASGVPLLLGISQFLLPEAIFTKGLPLISALFTALVTVLMIRVVILSIRRLHDLGYTRFIALLLLIPLLNIILLLILLFKKGLPEKCTHGAPAYDS